MMDISKPTIFISKNLNPFYNLSVGKYLSGVVRKQKIDKKILFLCTSHEGVFIGCNQNCWKECNFTEMEKDNVPLLRRDTGGGCNYVTKGNRLFSFIHKLNNENIDCNYSIIINALKKLNFDAQMKGRNDICINDKKVSGSAFCFDADVLRHHGTILVDIDKDKLNRYLNPNKLKLQSKGINSNISRIINLKEIDPEITFEKIDNSLIEEFYDNVKEPINIVPLEETNICNDKVFIDIYNNFTDEKFIFNKNPEFNCEFEDRFSFGTTQILFEVKNNRIEKIYIFSDSLDKKLINSLQYILEFNLSHTEFNVKTFYDFQEKVKKFIQHEKQLKEITDHIIKKLN